MVNWRSKKSGDLLWLLNGLVLLFLLNQLSSLFFFRIDLTEEKRYSIKPQTMEMLESLDDEVFIEVFLEGELNPGFRRLQKSVKEMLDVFRSHSSNKVRYEFTDPTTAWGQKARAEFMNNLAAKGIYPKNVIDTKDGKRSEQLIFPGALISYEGFEAGVMLLKGNSAQNSQEVLNQSIEGLEFEFANAIYKIANIDRKRIGWMTGHGELDSLDVASITNALLEQFNVYKIDLSVNSAIENYDAIIIAKPRKSFSELDKFKVDQYVMAGGRVLFLVDPIDAVMENVSSENYFAFPLETNLDDLFFRYGFRINSDLVQDRFSLKYPVVTGQMNGRPQVTPLDWYFYPLVNRYADHPVSRNLDASLLRFASTIDTVKAMGVRKTPLMFSSPYARKMASPVRISTNDLRTTAVEKLNSGPLPLAYLFEGSFTSLFKNRFLPDSASTENFRQSGEPTKIVVIADGDIARNDIKRQKGGPHPLGFDSYSGYTFANEELLTNVVAYLADDNGLINVRNKEIKIRPLDKAKIAEEKNLWQALNLLLPLVLVAMAGIARTIIRRITYSHF